MKIHIGVVTVILISGVNISMAYNQKMWDLEELSKPPRTYPARGFEPVGSKDLFYKGIINTPELKKADSTNKNIKAVFFDSVPYKGKPTRVFAYYGVPKTAPGEKIPAMVLIHGGGGTAFESWVRLWNARGYAAIAMDTCGSVPKGEYGSWEHHEYSGPAGWGGIEQTDWDIKDQWTYHAVASVILSHSLIRAFPQVDKDKIGVTGISWGGYLTSIVTGVDNRFKFAVPVYGCGCYSDSGGWDPFFALVDKSKADWWMKTWDPSVYLKYAKMPILWVNGTNDFAYHMNAWQKSYRTAKGKNTLCLKINMPHAHGGAGENPEEIHGYANSFCKDDKPLAEIKKQECIKDTIWVHYKSAAPIKKAELVFTKDTENWFERKWEASPAKIDGDRVTAELPENVSVYYMNLIDERGYTVSSEHVEIKSKK